MTDNFEDLEHQPDHQQEEQQPPKTGFRANLIDAWRTRPIFKLLVIMVVAGAAIAAAGAIFSSSPPEAVSKIVNPPDMQSTPGGRNSPYFLQQTKEAEKRREQEALAQGQSAFPTPIGQPVDAAATEKNDQLNELRAELAKQKTQMTQIQQQEGRGPGQGQQPERFDDTLAQAMQQQLRQMMESWVPKGIKSVKVNVKEETAGGKAGAAGENANGAATGTNIPAKIIVTAGTVSYAQLLVEANSDVPGPILAQIVSGPLSGARAIGSFQIANSYNDYLVLHFTRVNFKGKDYVIDAYALDPDTTLAGMATEVDQRYFTRVVLPAAAGFLRGLGAALGQTNETVTVTNGLEIVQSPQVGIDRGLAEGMGQAASVAGQFFENQANQTRPLVRVASGTPMGLFFVSSVTDQTPTQIQQANGQNGQNGQPNGYPPGYPGGLGAPSPGLLAGYPGLGGSPFGGSAYPGASPGIGYSGYPTGGGSGGGYPGSYGNVNGYGGGGYGGGFRTAPAFGTNYP